MARPLRATHRWRRFSRRAAHSHAELVLRKGYHPEIDSYSAFYENDRKTATGLSGYLRERGFTRVFIAGLAFDFCARYSAEDAQREGFDVVVIEDACRTIDMDRSDEATRHQFKSLGIRVRPGRELAWSGACAGLVATRGELINPNCRHVRFGSLADILRCGS